MTLVPGIYRHYKGPLYRIERVVSHSETEELFVVYQALYGDYSWWCRPLAMFTELVDVAGQKVARFQLQTPFAENVK